MKNFHRTTAVAAVAAVGMLLAACGEGNTSQTQGARQPVETTQRTSQPGPVDFWFTSTQVHEGRGIFNDNCASCHGAMGQGGANWRQRGPDGNYPPPPLNGSGHTWHHPREALEQVIRHGGPVNMPAWGGRLNNAQIEAVLAYVQSLWPERVYAQWAERTR